MNQDKGKKHDRINQLKVFPKIVELRLLQPLNHLISHILYVYVIALGIVLEIWEVKGIINLSKFH